MTSVISDIFQTAQKRFQKGDTAGAIGVIAESGDRDLFLRLVECKLAEEAGNTDSAENGYLELLEAFGSVGTACPLGLLHYLGFIARSRGEDEALSTFDDLCVAESEHVTPELFPAVALAIGWYSASGTREVRLSRATSVFRAGLARLTKKKRVELIIDFADFLALSANELKQAELELSGAADASDTSNKVWQKWEEILVEFNADLDTVRGMNRMKQGLQGRDRDGDQLVEDVGGIVTISDHPESAVDSWLLSHPSGNVIHSVFGKFKIDSILPETAVLESVLGLTGKIGQLTGDEGEDTRDGGMEPTNHVFRPDVTKMLRYVPQDDIERKTEIPSFLKNLIALLPSRTLKHANSQYIADQCIRLLVSVNLPSRVIAEDTFTNVDKRTRAAYEQKYVKLVPTVAAPALAVKEKEKPDEETFSKVKKEEIFDPVEYYNKKA